MSERGIWLDGSHLLLAAPTEEAVFLGLADGTPLFADDVSATAATSVTAPPATPTTSRAPTRW